MLRPSWLMALSAMAGSLLGLAAPEASGILRGSVGPSDPTGDLAECLQSQQLVVRGTLVAMMPVNRVQVGGMRSGVRGPYAAWDIHVRVDSVLLGVVDSVDLTLTTVHRGMYPPGDFVAGRPVLAWGFRNVVDGWRLYGDAVSIGDQGEITAGNPVRCPMFLKEDEGRSEPTYLTVLARLKTRDRTHLAQWLVGAPGAAVARVASIDRDALGLSCRTDSIVQVVGSGDPPRGPIRFLWTNGCFYDVDEGDWLLVPTTREGASLLIIEACPYTFIVRDGYVRSLGVPIGQIARVVQMTPQGILLRTVLESVR